MPAPKNNKFAAKPPGEAASEIIRIRVRADQKAEWKAKANAAGLTLSRWITQTLRG